MTVSGPGDTAVNKTKGKSQPSCNYRKKREKWYVSWVITATVKKMEQRRGLRSAGREELNLILNSKMREGFTEKGTTEQSLKEMKGVRHKAI